VLVKARGLGLIFACVCAFAADLPKLPPETMGLIDQARALPPEFSADTLLTLAGSRLITERPWKLQLIQEAFTTAAQAQVPYSFICHGPVDVIQCQETGLDDRGLTVLGLQTRAIEAMLAIDPPKALGIFQELAPPRVSRVTCQDVVTPDVSAYYQTAVKVFERGFTPKQREREDDLHLLETAIASMQSPAHVAPVMQMLSAVKVTGEQRKALLARFGVVLDGVSGSDRIFRLTEWAIVPAAFPETLEPRRLPRPFLPEAPDVAMYLPALRSYIARQLGGPRCSDRATPGKLPQSATNFNTLAAKVDPAALLYKPISEEEAKPLKDDGTYKYDLPWKSQRSKDVLEAERWLQHGNRQLPDDQRFWTLEERSTDEWIARYQDTMKLLAGWKEEEEASADTHYWLVAQAYSMLARLIPPGPARENAMGVYLNFLETRYTAVKSRNLWFVWVRDLLDSARLAKDPAEREWILDRLARSANPVIALYANLNRLAGK
jgi:hypothetical protein